VHVGGEGTKKKKKKVGEQLTCSFLRWVFDVSAGYTLINSDVA
jgi:nitrite reductase/ring-hydroxylating ferredoxin subunit